MSNQKFEQVKRRMVERNFFKYLSLRMREGADRQIAVISRKLFFSKTPVDQHKVLFMHYNNAYECNPAYICDEIIRQKLPWNLVFVSDQAHMAQFPSPFPEKVRVVKRGSMEHFYEMASAKVWIDNALCIPWEYMPKKQEQIYINTWHGSMGLKRIDSDSIESSKWRAAAKKAGKLTDYMISNSAFETEVYRSTHWPDPKVKILEYGHPRNDILFCDDQKKADIHSKVCRAFHVDEDCHFILYAPTFRDSRNLNCYDIDYPRLLKAVTERFGGKWKILNRYHFKVASAIQALPDIQNNPDILDGNSYADIQELMVAADIGITDYSSWICDFVLTGKPGFIYANDLHKYNKERGFYYPLESTPFPIATNNDEMAQNILTFDEKEYQERKEQFLKDRGCTENGHASQRVIDLIKSHMEGTLSK